MKTYAEKNKEKPFDWFEALSKDCSKMTIFESQNLKNKSTSWVTCACGNLCDVIERKEYGDHEDGKPKDEILGRLGNDFHHSGVKEMFWAISEGNIVEANKMRKQAISILKKIEKRSVIVMKMQRDKAVKMLNQMGYTVKIEK